MRAPETRFIGRTPLKQSHKQKIGPAIPDVKVVLSRPAYPLGGTLVGTVIIEQAACENDSTTIPLRSLLESVTVYVAGFCKIDARWHDCSEYTKIYGKTHPQIKPLMEKVDANLLDQNDDTVCFWATNGLEALDLPERSDGRLWKNVETDFQRGLHLNEDDEHDETETSIELKGEKRNDPISRDIFAFTFRVDIPEDLPHSVYATTCRYFYAAHVLVKTAAEQTVVKKNFDVISCRDTIQHQVNPLTSTRVKFGNCLGLAHSNGLPCHLSVTEIHRPKGQLVVVQNHCLVKQYQRQGDVQMLKVTTSSGQPVCLLTIIGSQSLCPGSCVHLKWDFPNNNTTTQEWIPCHQVCACLQGEEYAIHEDESKKRTQAFLFDTCHEYIDPGITDTVSKTLWLSSSGDGIHFEGSPCDLKTDVMEVSTWCRVDITVGEPQQVGESKFQNLSLQIPCRVKLRNSTNDDMEEQLEQRVTPLNELLNIAENSAFPTNDIGSDLKTLSLAMHELVVCGGTQNVPTNSGQ